MNANPDDDLETKLADDIAIESADKGTAPGRVSKDKDEAAKMDEAQQDAAEERKEGGYQ